MYCSRCSSIYLSGQPPEFQLEPLPKTNPVLEGVRWKQYHAALGPTLTDIPKESWETVKKEKAVDMTHVLDFPYNGEPPKVSISTTLGEHIYAYSHR